MTNDQILESIDHFYTEWRTQIDEGFPSKYQQAESTFRMYSKYRKARAMLHKPVSPEHKSRFVEIGREILTVGMGLDEDEIQSDNA